MSSPSPRPLPPLLARKLRSARKWMNWGDIQRTCNLLLEISDSCERYRIPEPPEIEQLAEECMRRDVSELRQELTALDQPPPWTPPNPPNDSPPANEG